MFLCDRCHDPNQHLSGFRSLGACEGCGRQAACIDCHQRDCNPPRAKRKKTPVRKKKGTR